MQLRNHVVVVVTLLVVGTSAILAATVQSSTSCPTPATPSLTMNIATSELCVGILDEGCPPVPQPVAVGHNLRLWGVQQGCFGPAD
jgi:hypothetical protein